MKITQEKLSKKHWLIAIIAIVIVVLGVGFGVYALKNNHKDNSTSSNSSKDEASSDDSSSKVNTDAPTSGEIDAGNSTKSNNNDNASQTPTTPSEDMGLSITANNTGSTIQVRSTITSPMEDASCSLVLTKGDTTITKDTVGVQALPGYSTCKGWDIENSTLGSGSWTATVTVTHGSATNTAKANFQI